MKKSGAQAKAQPVVYLVTYSLLLGGLFYAGYINEHLKGAIPNVHRGVLVGGFILGAYAASTYIGLALAKRLVLKKISNRR